MKNILLILVFAYAFPNYANNTTDWKKEYISIEKEITEGVVAAKFISIGGYSGECVMVDISNLSNKEQKILLEAGDKLLCKNEEMQNIFISQTQYIVLAPKATKRNKIIGFCCASSKSAPSNSVMFNYLNNENLKELKLANFLDLHPNLDINAVQHAVWVVCNDANIDGIYAEDPSSILELKKLVSSITGKEIPWYTKKYNIDSTGRLLETSSKLIAIMNFNLNKEASITVQICNDKDDVLKIPMQEKLLQRGYYDYQFTWETNRLPKGKYIARVFSDGQMIQEKEILL